MQTYPNLSMDYLPVIVRADSFISTVFAAFCLTFSTIGIIVMGIFFKWHAKDFIVLTPMFTIFIAGFLGLFFRKIDLYINTKFVKWRSARWPMLTIKWEQPFNNYNYLVIEETTPSPDFPELLHYHPNRLTLLRRGKYDQIESHILHIMLHHSTEPEKFSVSLACFGFSEFEKAEQYLDSAHRLLGLPKALLKNGNIEEIEDLSQLAASGIQKIRDTYLHEKKLPS